MLRYSASVLTVTLIFIVGGCQTQPGPDEEAGEAVPYDQQQAGEQEITAEQREAEEGEELAPYMSTVQRWTHKLLLSTQAENQELALFYLDELRSQAVTIRNEVPTYEGFPIRNLMGALLMPQLDQLQSALEGENWQQVAARTEAMVNACNQCHTATEHAFIQVSSDPLPNPYLQSFEPMPAGAQGSGQATSADTAAAGQ